MFSLFCCLFVFYFCYTVVFIFVWLFYLLQNCLFIVFFSLFVMFFLVFVCCLFVGGGLFCFVLFVFLGAFDIEPSGSAKYKWDG